MVRESLREDALVPHELDAEFGLVGLRTREDSGSRTEEEAGLDAMALDETDDVSGLSHGTAFCRRKEAGLMRDPEEAA